MYNIANLVYLIPYSRFQFEPHPSFQVPNSKSQITHSIFPIQIPHSTFHFPNLYPSFHIHHSKSQIFQILQIWKVWKLCLSTWSWNQEARSQGVLRPFHIPCPKSLIPYFTFQLLIPHYNISFHIPIHTNLIPYSTFQVPKSQILHPKCKISNLNPKY
jgi:hypothetical protein